MNRHCSPAHARLRRLPASLFAAALRHRQHREPAGVEERRPPVRRGGEERRAEYRVDVSPPKIRGSPARPRPDSGEDPSAVEVLLLEPLGDVLDADDEERRPPVRRQRWRGDGDAEPNIGSTYPSPIRGRVDSLPIPAKIASAVPRRNHSAPCRMPASNAIPPANGPRTTVSWLSNDPRRRSVVEWTRSVKIRRERITHLTFKLFEHGLSHVTTTHTGY